MRHEHNFDLVVIPKILDLRPVSSITNQGSRIIIDKEYEIELDNLLECPRGVTPPTPSAGLLSCVLSLLV